jgi:hypothetical protein
MVLYARRAGINGARPHFALANKTSEEFRAQRITFPTPATVKNYNPGLYF